VELLAANSTDRLFAMGALQVRFRLLELHNLMAELAFKPFSNFFEI
jgi:hypothetical protein